MTWRVRELPREQPGAELVIAPERTDVPGVRASELKPAKSARPMVRR